MRRLVPRSATLVRYGTVVLVPLTLALMLAAGVAGGPAWFLAAAVLGHLAEAAVLRWVPDSARPMRWGSMGPGTRMLTRQAAFLLLLVRADDVSDVMIGTAVAGFFLLDWLRTVALAGAIGLGRTNKIPFCTRNLGAGEPAYPASGPAWQTRLVVPLENHADAVPVLLGAVGLLAGVAALLPVGLVLTGAVTLALAAGQTIRLRRMGSLLNGDRTGRVVQKRVDEYKPEVILYFTGTDVNAYQGNMWLETLERLDRKAMVLVRSAEVVRALAPTKLPVVSIARAEDVMNFDWSSVRVALYTGNTGKNLHMLREPDIKHVFIGHGDSDKDSSSNPVSKVFDEVWVAGPAGRDRYRNSEAGVRDEAIVEVGRPQLDGITADPTGNDVPVVLYAPTWEGWDSDHSYSSLLPMGEKIIGTLLKEGPRLRVIYRPHPYTGTRSAAAHAAHGRIVKMIEQANRTGGGAHAVVTGAEASLHDCFNRSDMLITDISSVISDYMPSLKPYVVANPHAADDAEFRADFPSAGAAYLLGPDCTELSDIIAVTASPGADPLAKDRRALRDYLLGPEHPDAMTRFNTAVNELAESAPRSVLLAAGAASPAAAGMP